MRRLALLGLSLLTSCGEATMDPFGSQQSAMFDGQADPADPAMVQVGGAGVWCSGTLISPKVVLTAGHCMLPGAASFVFFGSNYLQRDGIVISSTDAYSYPNWAQGSDIGIVVLQESAPVPPVPLNGTTLDATYVGKHLRTVAWGMTDVSDDLHFKQAGGGAITQIDALEIQASAGVCHGDSGGAGLLTLPSGQEVLAGVIDWTSVNACTVANSTAGLTRVDVYLSWIQDQIAANDPPSCDTDFRCVAGCASPDPDCACVAGQSGRACNDNDPCTVNETCNVDGMCGGTPVSCDTPPACQTTGGTCNNVGTCIYAPEPDGMACAIGFCSGGHCIPPLTNGACGSADGVPTATKPTTGLCSAGQNIRVDGTGPWTWTCWGVSGGTNASCSAPLLGAAPIDAVCGSANGVATDTGPAAGLCNPGTPSAVAGTGPWTWTCAGSNGGSSSSCSAPVNAAQVDGACGAANGATLPAAPPSNLCSAGTASAVDGSGPWTWTCTGTHAGATASCSAEPAPPDGTPGTCGSASAVSTQTAPADDLCSAGTASAVAGSGPWAWTCTGTDGTPVSCSTPGPSGGSDETPAPSPTGATNTGNETVSGCAAAGRGSAPSALGLVVLALLYRRRRHSTRN